MRLSYAWALAALATPVFAQPVEQRVAVCVACHGAAGASKLPGTPSLGGMPSDYILVQLLQFREKQRVAAPMNAMTAGLSDDDLQTLAERMSQLPPPVASAPAPDAAGLDHARALVAQYHCASCHGADFAGHDQIPRVADQREDYLAQALTQYKSNARAGYEPAMNEVAQEVKAEDIPVLAHYLATYRASAAAE